MVGGRLARFAGRWGRITRDSWILSTVSEGLTLAFTSPPPRGPHYRETPVPQDPELRRILEEELHELLRKGAVVPCSQSFVPRFCATFFLTPKKGGKWRPILNLRPLNKFIVPRRFRMETLLSILRLLGPGLWATSVDLKDAYLHVPVRPEDQPYLCFLYRGRLFRFVAMPFGLSTAPRIFTRLSLAFAAFLRRSGVKIFMYLDDWLIVESSRDRCLSATGAVLREARALGWIVNLEKSELTPTQCPTYLGAVVDLRVGRAFPTLVRVEAVVSGASLLLQQSGASARAWLVLLGYMASLVDLVPYCRLRMRPLQWHLLAFFRPASRRYDILVPVTQVVLPHLSWWTVRRNLTLGVVFPEPPPDVTLTTDASESGWGAYIDEESVAGQWPPSWSSRHVNCLELEAVARALAHFRLRVQGHKVLVRTDSSTVVAYINRQGGTHSLRLWGQAWALFRWVIAHGVTLRAAHLPGEANVRADALSRLDLRGQLGNAQLLPDVFRRLCDRSQVFPEVDLFATPENAQTVRFCSRVHHPTSWKVNALSFLWVGYVFYAFPPPVLVPLVLQKIAADGTPSLLLVAPFWPTRPWFPQLVGLLAGHPFRLRAVRGASVISLPGIALETDCLSLVGWPLSGLPSARRAYRRRLPSWRPMVDVLRPWAFMIDDSDSMESGVRIARLVQVRHL